MIVCIGWGSLIWRPGGLLLVDPNDWRDDGPQLPIEFVRQSTNGCLTLVIDSHSHPLRVLWSPMSVSYLPEAIESLRKRERMPSDRRIGRWPADYAFEFADVVAAWAESRDIEGVVWTALGPKFDGVDGRRPSVDQAIRYLTNLECDRRFHAEEYVRKAPLQIDTSYRRAFVAGLGWTPTF